MALARQKLKTYEAEASVLPLEEQQAGRWTAAINQAINQVSRWASRRRQGEIATSISKFQVAAEADPATDTAALDETLALFEKWPAFVAELQGWDAELLRLREATESLRNEIKGYIRGKKRRQTTKESL